MTSEQANPLPESTLAEGRAKMIQFVGGVLTTNAIIDFREWLEENGITLFSHASALSAREDVAGLMRECKERMAECREALSVDPVDGPTYGLCLSIDDLLARIDAATGGPA